MSSTLLPFLYQTRTLQRSASRVTVSFARAAHSGAHRKSPARDNSIPFEWDSDSQHDELGNDLGQPSTITPSEAEVFKGIFDEIAQGKLPQTKKRPPTVDDDDAPTSDDSKTASESNKPQAANQQPKGMARSIVEQARVTEFRERFLRRYPKSLQNAAQVALGLYELEPGAPGQSQMMELDEADEKKWAERARFDRVKAAERERVEDLMRGCNSDAALWKVMEREVFSLPEKLGIAQQAAKSKPRQTKKRGKKASAAPADELSLGGASRSEETPDEARRVMDVHGPLYSHFLNVGLAMLDTAFARPSPLAFQILPRIKRLGLPSYVLGASTPFYARLARMHWARFGDAGSALDLLREMGSAGLYADEGVRDLLVEIRDHLHGCTWGAQGPFVMGMMEAAPYDGALTQRLEDMERFTRQSLAEQARGNAL